MIKNEKINNKKSGYCNQLEKGLDSYECRYRALFDNIESCIAIYRVENNGRDFIFVDFNKAAEKVDNIKKDKLIGKNVELVFPAIEKMGLLDIFKKVWETGMPADHPVSFYEDGRMSGWRKNYVYKLSDKEIVAIYSDITEQKQFEEKLENQNKFLANIISSLSHPFYVVDANNYSLIIANEAALQGRDIDSLTCYKISHKRDTPCGGEEHLCPMLYVKEHKKPISCEHIHFDMEGNPKYVEVHGYPIFDEKGDVAQMIEYCIDITERKKNEKEIKKNEEEILKRNLELEKFNKLFVGRELKMVDLKKQLKKLTNQKPDKNK